jgi:hypothetical protein
MATPAPPPVGRAEKAVSTSKQAKSRRSSIRPAV